MTSNSVNYQEIDKIERLQSKKITYSYIGIGCPLLVDTYTLYGFKTACVGCNIDDGVYAQNDLAKATIDSVYGLGWFDENEPNFHLKIKRR